MTRLLALRTALSIGFLLVAVRPAPAQTGRCADAELGGSRLRYCTAGSGRVTVVLEAGREGSLAVWDSLAPLVARFARVVTYDRAGHGSSPAVAGARGPTAIAADLHRLLERIGARPPFVLVALGSAAPYARAFALGQPDSVAGLVLLDPPSPAFESRRAAMLPVVERRVVDSVRSGLRAGLDSVTRGELVALDSIPAGYWDPPTGIPVVIFGADRHDWPPRTGAEMQELLWRDTQHQLTRAGTPGEWILLDGTGPAGVLARRDTVVAAVRRIVEAVPSGRAAWLTRLNDWLGGFLKDVGNVRALVLGAFTLLLGSALFPLVTSSYNTRKARRRKDLEEKALAPPPDPHLVPLARLVPPDAPAAGRAVRLLHALNQHAAGLYRARMAKQAPTDPDQERIWAQTWEPRDWLVQRSFIEPLNTGQGPQKYAALVVRGWLEDYAQTPQADRHHCEIWLRAAAGAGKSTLMSRLFFELIGATEPIEHRGRPVPEPMLLQPRNLESSHQPSQLRGSSDPFATFVKFWLDNRRVDVPERERSALIGDFREALMRGDIVLLIDGHDDQRRMGLGAFLEDLRRTATCWVAAERDDPDAPGGGGRREVNLADTWSLPEIRAHLDRRWGPSHRLHDQIGRVAKVLEAETDAAHWLRIPRSLDLFLAKLEDEGVPDQESLRGHCRGEAELLRSLYERSIERIRDSTAVEHRISERLCRIAASQVLGAEEDLGPAGPDDVVWYQVARLGEIVDRTMIDGQERLRIRSPAFRDFFLAGRIAFELSRPAGAAPVTLAGHRWSRSLLANVSDWLRDLKKGSDQVRARIPRPDASRSGSESPSPNLLHLLLRVELDALRRSRPGQAEWELRREVRVEDVDFRGADLADADLRLYRFERCAFDRASFLNADLGHAAFHDCSFAGADLSQADAIGAEFLGCRFLGDEGAAGLKVTGLEIESTEFTAADGADASDVTSAELCARGASITHSRYRGAFGRLFLNAQESFLGPDLTRLETGAYRERIRTALGRVPPERPAYLVDLMAGGGSERLATLLGRDEGAWPNLHVMGVDRDDPTLRAMKRDFPYRFEGRRWEIGSAADGRLDLDLGALLGEAFGSGDRLAADVIIAKKALHEIERPLQPRMLDECFRALRPGGTFVLFADTPGGPEGSMTESQFSWLDRTVRPLLIAEDTPISAVRDLVLRASFGDSVSDRALFTNTWILLKDWANGNTHEVEHRYFASAAEIDGWARSAGLSPEVPAPGQYTIAVALFNETGIRHAMHHLERRGVDLADETALREWLTGVGQPRFALLREFTEHHLADGTPLARALGATTEEIGFDRVHPRLRAIRQRSRAFKLPIHVLSYVRPVAATGS